MSLDPGVRMHGGHEINRSTASGIPRVVVPVTTNTVTLGLDDHAVWINPAGTIAALTILLPPQPSAGSIVSISFGQIVTALTVQDANGNAVESSAGAVSVANEYRFVGTAWVRWR
jgi:hypothetical protein